MASWRCFSRALGGWRGEAGVLFDHAGLLADAVGTEALEVGLVLLAELALEAEEAALVFGSPKAAGLMAVQQVPR